MKKLLVTILVLTLTGTVSTMAHAQFEPDLDVLGVFFDQNGTAPEIGIAPYVPFNAYFLLLNGSATQIAGYEFSYQVDIVTGAGSGFMRLGVVYPDGVIVLPSDYADPLAGEFVVSWPAPVPLQQAHHLLTWQMMLLQPSFSAQITTGAVANPTEPWGVPIYWDGTNSYGLAAPWCSGRINNWCPIPTETQSFGAVKSLYR